MLGEIQTLEEVHLRSFFYKFIEAGMCAILWINLRLRFRKWTLLKQYRFFTTQNKIIPYSKRQN